MTNNDPGERRLSREDAARIMDEVNKALSRETAEEEGQSILDALMAVRADNKVLRELLKRMLLMLPAGPAN